MFGRKRTLAEAADEVVALALTTGALGKLQKAIQECFRQAERSAGDETERAMVTLAQAISVPDEDRAWAVAFLCGALVERGADPRAMEEPLLARLRALAGAARKFHAACQARMPAEPEDRHAEWTAIAERLAPSLPAEARAYRRLAEAYPPAIALMSASASARSRARALLPDLALMKAENPGASWVCTLAQILDDEPYLALEPATGVGIAGRMSGIADNFQLHTLLMDVFPRRGGVGPRVSRAAAATARGVGPQQLDETLIGAWNLHAWPAVQPSGELRATQDAAATAHWIWNEGTPADIPTFEERRVILLGPPSYQRAWRAQRAFAALAADLTVEERLGTGDVLAWVGRMAARST